MQCPHCGTAWPDELKNVLKFCGACGKSMNSDSPAPQDAPITTNDPGGELRYMTVIFADLAGFTAFSEDRTPDEVARIVGGLLQRLGKVVEEHNGAVDKFLGDAVVATFGLPKPDPNATRNAVRAGMEMQNEVAHFNTEEGFSFGLRVGIHAGQAMFRSIGGSWTVMGDTVNTASRIQSAAAPGKVWISQPIYEEVRRFFNLDLRPAVELKGKKHVIQPYEVISERETPQLELPPFVGREKEWLTIRNKLDECLNRNITQALLIRGSAGVGKSRLTWELREWAQRSDQLYKLDIIQYDHSERLPSHGLNTLIRNRFNLPLEMNEESILKQLAQRLPEVYPGVPKGRESLAVEFFAFVLGILRPDFQIVSMDGKGKWNNAFLEIKNWLETEARKEPWILIFEDAQKGDADTAAFFDWALSADWTAPILILVTVRDEDFGPECYWHQPINRWVGSNLVEEMRLREIAPEVLSHALIPLGAGKISANMALRIAEHTEGNPLFATELVLLIKDQGASEPEHMPLPGSIREVMEARLERLGLAGKEVAKRGALMGRRFTMDAVGRIWDRPKPEMNSGMRVLQETETIYEEASKLFAGEMEKVFRHGRLHEAALARIPREERLRWLAGLEEWAKNKLESFGEYWEGAGIMLVPLVARSRIEHEDHDGASLWYEALGWLHRKNHRSTESAAAFRQSLENASGLRRLVLQRMIAELESYGGELERSRQTALSALAENNDATLPVPEIPPRFAGLVDDPLARWGQISLTEACIALQLACAETLSKLGLMKEVESFYSEIRSALESLHGQNADIMRIRWTDQWGYFLTELRGDPTAAKEVFDALRRNVDLSAPGLQSQHAAIISSEFNIEMRLGHYDRAHLLAGESLKLAQAEGNIRSEARAWNSIGITLISIGNWKGSAESYERSLELARIIGERRLEVIALHNLGLTRMDQALYAEARECQESYLSISRATGNHMAESYAPSTLATIAMSQGDFERAEALIEQSLKVAQENDWSRLISWNQALRGLLAFYRWMKSDGDQLRLAIDAFASSEDGWKLLDEAGEFYAALAIATYAHAGADPARQVLERAHNAVDESWTAARILLELGETVIDGRPLNEIICLFREKGFERGAVFAEKIGLALGK